MASDGLNAGTAAACAILGLSFVIGAPGNLLVIWTILRHVKKRSHTVVLILHLAVADLLVLVTLPLWIYSLAWSWAFGEASCKALVYVVNACMYGSVFLVTLMSVDRFLAICHPFKMMLWKTRRTLNVGPVVLWLVALLLSLPAATSQTLSRADGREQCLARDVSSVTQTVVHLCVETLGGFAVPLVVLVACYCLVAAQLRKMTFVSKQKSVILVHAVVTAFVLCWLPYHVINIIDSVCVLASSTREPDCLPRGLVYSSGALVFISSSVNPVLYTFFARNLKGSLQESRLVRLFQEVASHTHRPGEQQCERQTGDAQEGLTSSGV